MHIAALLFAVLCGFGPPVQIKEETYTLYETVLDTELFAQAKTNIAHSSYFIVYNFSRSEWYAIGLAVLTAIPALYTYIRSIEKTHHFSLIRSSYKAYSAGVILSSFFSGLLIVVEGILLYTAAAYIVFPSFSSFGDPTYQMIYGDAYSRLFSFAKQALNHAFVGGIIPVFAITLYRFIHSDFLAATVPMMLAYISMKVLPNYYKWIYADTQRLDSRPAIVVSMFFPSNLTELGNGFEYSLNAPFWLAYIVLTAYLFIMYLLFYRSIRRV